MVYYHPMDGAGYGPGGFEEEERFDPLKLIWYVIHYRWLIAAFLLAGIVVGVLVTLLQTPLYSAVNKIEIDTSGNKVIQDLSVTSLSSDLRAFQTAREEMLSRDVAKRVVFKLDLANDDKFLAPTPTFSLMNLVHRALGTPRTADLEGLSAEDRQRSAIKKIMDNLDVDLIRDTSILSINYTHADPKYAAEVANQVAHSFIDQNVDRRSETSDLARQFIQQQVIEAKNKLQDAESRLVAYAKQAGIAIIGDSSDSLISANITELNKALADAIEARVAAKRFYDQVKEGNASTLPEVFASDSIQNAKQKIAELKATYQQKRGTLKPDFPEMLGLKAQINQLEDAIDQEVGAIAKSVEIRYQQAQQKVAALQTELDDLSKQQSDFQDKSIQYSILKREVDSDRAQYDNLVTKLNEAGVGAELRTANASIVESALPPTVRSSPSLKKDLALAIALFGALAAGLIYIIELLNNTFSVPDQVEKELKLPVLGIIPMAKAAQPLEEFDDPKSGLSEAYRSLRTSLQFTGTEHSIRSLFVTSAEPSEGKSTTAYKLAQDFCALGRQVIIIDADMRKPQLHRFFKVSNTLGLSNLLSSVAERREVSSFFHQFGEIPLMLLPAGTIPPNPVDLLTSQRMALILQYCSKNFDLTIIDGPPVMGLSDAPILARQTDATLLVVAAKQATRKSVKSALGRLKAAGGNVVGAALTKFSVDRLDYNYAYRYMNYNYYNYDTAEIEDQTVPEQAQPPLHGKLARLASDLLDRLMRRAA
ncbi:MAG: hypothetical protein BGN87_09035 [Rhizobiales bacterium 65-79]|nr:MAG: hypothetical protein BGN87_09035 [Rhizobiales bacterium 65-79]